MLGIIVLLFSEMCGARQGCTGFNEMLCVLDLPSSWYLNKVRPTWWHLLYYVNLLLKMFQMLIHPSSEACDYLVRYCVGCIVLTWGVLVLCSGIGCWWCGIWVQAEPLHSIYVELKTLRHNFSFTILHKVLPWMCGVSIPNLCNAWQEVWQQNHIQGQYIDWFATGYETLLSWWT